MSTKTFNYKPVRPGFPWDAILRIQSKTPFFVLGASYRAEIRVNENSPLIATITTENGGITVLDGERVQVNLTGIQTGPMRTGSVYFDLIRTDGPEPQHTGLRVQVRVSKSITAAHAAA
jgi:hypothetical protein